MTLLATAQTFRGACQTIHRIASQQPIDWVTDATFREDPAGKPLVGVILPTRVEMWARTVDGRLGTLEALIDFDPIASVQDDYERGLTTQAEKLCEEARAKPKCENCSLLPQAIILPNGRRLCHGCAQPYLPSNTRIFKERAVNG